MIPLIYGNGDGRYRLASPGSRAKRRGITGCSTTSVLALWPGRRWRWFLLRVVLPIRIRCTIRLPGDLLGAVTGGRLWPVFRFLFKSSGRWRTFASGRGRRAFRQLNFFSFHAKRDRTSHPARPPPMTTTLSEILSRLRYSSLTTTTCSPSMPLIGGTSGREPAAMMRASGASFSTYSGVTSVLEADLHTCIFAKRLSWSARTFPVWTAGQFRS